MIDQQEIASVAARFGAPETQIIRDHLISHVLSAIGKWPDRDDLTFFGGTALCRTWLPDLRLSEDIDLLVEASVDAENLRHHVSSAIRRNSPNLTWNRLRNQNDVDSWTLGDADRQLKVEFVRWRDGWQEIPIAASQVRLRYSDLPETIQLQVPTPTGFGAMKLMAWFDRHTPRDLYDLAALADEGHIDATAVRLVKAVAGFTPTPLVLQRTVPRKVESAWQAELGHQVADISTPSHCLERVRAALGNTNPDTI